MTGDRVSEIREIKDRKIRVDANAYLNIKPDVMDHRDAYVDRRNLLTWLDEANAELTTARRQLTAVEAVVEMYSDLPGYGAILYNLRAALNQGGETNGE